MSVSINSNHKDFATKVRFEIEEQRAVQPMVERFLTQRAVHLTAPDPTKISFVIQDLGGFGDLIFGVRALKVLKNRFPNTSFHMVTNGVEKLKKVLAHTPLDCSIHEIKGLAWPSFDLETQNHLETSDIVFASPTGCHFMPPKVVQEKRDITLIEYNRPSYGLDIAKRRYVTGIGDQSCGVFIEPSLESAGRKVTLERLDNRPLAGLLQSIDPQNNTNLYFGYGHKDVEQFLNVLLNYETHNAVILTPPFNKEKLCLPNNATVIVHYPANFPDVLKALQKQGAPIDLAQALAYRQILSDRCKQKSLPMYQELQIETDLEAIDQVIAKAEQNLPQETAFVQSLEDGYCGIEGTWFGSDLLKRAPDGNTIHFVVFSGLSSSDTQKIKSIADEICLSTGDQSFSEDLGKLMMYDTRKPEPILALAEVAQKNGLHQIAEYFLSFSQEHNVEKTISSLKNRDQLRKEMDKLYEIICQDMDLAPQLIGLVLRQMRGQLDAARVHEAFMSYALTPKDESLVKIQAEIAELEKR